MHALTRSPGPQVRDLLLRKQERLAASLKALAARVPRSMLSAAGAKFAELERALRAKAGSIEDVDAQRRLIAELPGKIAPLVAELEAAKVRLLCVQGALGEAAADRGAAGQDCASGRRAGGRQGECAEHHCL